MYNFKAIIFDLDDTLYDTSNRIDDVTPNYTEMKLYDGVKDILESISAKKILITQGNIEMQNKKIDTLGVRNLFDEIIILPNAQAKLPEFEKIKLEFSNPKDVAVVGDRRDAEIRYGNMMGFVSILLNQGKYKDLAVKDDLDISNYEVGEFKGILEYI